jgi:hypothetical protein
LLDHRCLRSDAVGAETRRLVNLFKTFAKNVRFHGVYVGPLECGRNRLEKKSRCARSS